MENCKHQLHMFHHQLLDQLERERERERERKREIHIKITRSIPRSINPACLQITLASRYSKYSSQTRVKAPLTHTVSTPENSLGPPNNLTSPSVHATFLSK